MSNQEPWYKKQMKDPTGINNAMEKNPMLTGCVTLIFLAVVVFFAIYLS
jgi:hypothetical protein